MHRGAVLAVGLSLVLALPLVLPAVAVADVPDARIAVSDVTVAPGTPTVDEQVTVTATVRNSGGSAAAATVDRVALRSPSGRVLAAATGLGSLSAGDTLAVPLATRFPEAGDRTLTLRIEATDTDGESVTVTRPVPVAIERAPPRATVTVADAAVDSPTRLRIALGNPTTAPMRDVVVAINGTIPTLDGRDRRAVPSLAAGATRVVNLTVVPRTAGERTVRLDVGYTTASGTERVRTETVPLAVAPYRPDLGVEISRVRPEPADDGGGLAGIVGGGSRTTEPADETAETTRFELTLTNFGTVRVRDAVITPRTANASLPRVRLDGPLAPGESGAVEVDLGRVRAHGPVTFEVGYRAGVRHETTSARLDYRPRIGEVRLSDVDVTVSDGRVRLTGNAVNVGRGEVTGVVLGVGTARNVTPAYPQRSYFVGRMAGSDFAPFELTARQTGRIDALAVDLEYRVDGAIERRTVRFPPPASGAGGGESGDGGGATTAAAAALAVGLVATASAAGYAVWRRRR